VLEGSLPDLLKNLDQGAETLVTDFPELGGGKKEADKGKGKGKGKEKETVSSPAPKSAPSTAPEKQKAKEEPQKDLLASRSNVYDGDEFDAFTQSLDLSRVQVGKKRFAVFFQLLPWFFALTDCFAAGVTIGVRTTLDECWMPKKTPFRLRRWPSLRATMMTSTMTRTMMPMHRLWIPL